MSKATKRKRVEGTVRSLPSKRKKTDKDAQHRPIVRGDALRWKEVDLPDRLEDAEGFYGLEEVEDVEVVKDENGQITFRPKTVKDIIIGDNEVPGEEWAGFDEATGNDQDTKERPGAVSSVIALNERVSKDVTASSEQIRQMEKAAKKEKKAAKASVLRPKDFETMGLEDEVDFGALNDTEEQPQADVTAWKELGISPDVLCAISALGFSNPTPIQKAAIGPIKEGRDVIGKAVTGSGKTLAFGIPIVEKWLESRTTRAKAQTINPIAFILAPTRELAHQLSKHLNALARGLSDSLRIATVTGGLAVVKQQRQLEHADIIVGTPGRLWEVINSSHGLVERLKQIRFLVVDEADRLLSEGHFKEVEEILDVLDRKVVDETRDDENEKKRISDPRKTSQRQTLVFSATFAKDLQQKLASKQKWRQNESNLLSNTQSLEYLVRKLRFQKGVRPTFIDANPTSSMAENLTESILECGAMQKDLYLYSLLLLQQHQHDGILRSNPMPDPSQKITRTLVFTNSISTVKRLVPLLSSLSIPNTSILPLHSSMAQKARLRSLERFTTPTNQSDTTAILIATDVAARGLDIKGVTTVVHYHVPRTADMYVHRSGRTARASSSGRSFLICSPDEIAGVTRLISKIHADKQQHYSKGNSTKSKNVIQTFYLPASLPTQLQKRVSLAQKVTETTLSNSQSKSEDSWLRKAAEDLGVDYSSDEFEENSKRGRRGRGSAREKKKKDAEQVISRGDVARWKAELREESKQRRIDFGDGLAIVGSGRYLAGGAVDMERLLRDGI